MLHFDLYDNSSSVVVTLFLVFLFLLFLIMANVRSRRWRTNKETSMFKIRILCSRMEGTIAKIRKE